MKVASIIVAIIIFSVVVIFHELGHFLLAKANGIRVNEFCLGLGPTLIGFTRGETKYSLKLLPFGGACMMEGEDQDSDDDRAFLNKSVWARISVVFAGPFFNFILAFLLAIVVMACVGCDEPVLTYVTEGGAADEAGLQAGDRILKLDHTTVHFYKEVRIYTTLHPGEDVEVLYERDGEVRATTVSPRYDEERDRYMFGFNSQRERTKGGPIQVVTDAFYELRYWIRTTVQSLKMLFTGMVSVNELSGPVGIVKNIGDTYVQSASQDGYYYAVLNMLNWAILLSANLGIMNLLPLPALDGGRLVFLIIEAIRRKKIPVEKESVVHLVGIVLLLLLMIVVMFNDIRKIIL